MFRENVRKPINKKYRVLLLRNKATNEEMKLYPEKQTSSLSSIETHNFLKKNI